MAFAGRLASISRSPAAIAGAAASLALLAVAAFGPAMFGEAAAHVDLDAAIQGPSAQHLLGTDELGRDLLARVITATRVSLGLSLLATLIGAAVGIGLGALPAVTAPWVGRIVTSIVNLALAFPALLLTLFVAAIVGAGVKSATLAIAVALAPIFARLAHTLSAGVQNADYVSAARALGVKPLTILTRHIVPNIAGPLLVTGVMGVSSALIVLAGLSFLGLGVQPPNYDWGALLNQGLNRIYVSPASALAPAAAIVLAGVGLSLAGETLAMLLGLREAQPTHPSRDAPRVTAEAAAAPSAGALLQVEDLRVTASAPGGARIDIVRGLSFSLEAGERVAIVGESGSGKTMAALAIAQLLDGRAHAQAKLLTFAGRPLLGPNAIDRQAIRSLLAGGLPMVFQDPLGAFNPLLKVGPQIAEVATTHDRIGRRDSLARAIDRLGAVAIDAPARRAAQRPYELSGGMLQRAMIAMALMLKPRLVIADEPTTALDVTVQKQVLELIDRACEEAGAGLLLISHDLAVVTQACDRVLVMYAGRIVEDLSADQLLAGPAHPYTQALLEATLDMNTPRGLPLATLRGRARRPGEAGEGCAFAARCGQAVSRCYEHEPPLDVHSPGQRAACWRPLTPAGEQR